MTHHNVSYEHIDNEDIKQAKALTDIREYIGTEKFIELNRSLSQWVREDKPTLKEFEWVLFLFPVSGYPIKAWYEVLNTVHTTEPVEDAS